MKIAILGMGTVGSGVLKVIQENQKHIKKFADELIEVTHVFGNSINDQHNLDLSNITITSDLNDILESDVELVVEVLGGIDFTYSVHKQFLAQGIHVVSANKDMLAIHINELAQIGNDNRAQLAYEASSAGGIPIINALTYGLQSNIISRLMGILNGTTNYILTKMTAEGTSYEDALAQAQELGYAEKDPTNDVEGYDARRKIALLSRIAYDLDIQEEEIEVKGISSVSTEDLEYGKQAGLVMKLLGKSEYKGDSLSINVEPVFLPVDHQLATVNEAANAVYVNGNAFGETMFYGPGAGSLETASAVVADIMNIMKFGFVGNLVVKNKAKISQESSEGAYYIRFTSKEAAESLAIQGKLISEDKGHWVILADDVTNAQVQQLKTSDQVEVIYSLIRD
ncbi:homoserine dehydrogenase [Aerococcaceae bacterium WGS1372]